MDIDISSFIGKLKSPALPGRTSKPEGRVNQSKAIESPPDSRKVPIAKSSESQVDVNTFDNNKVDYKVDHETNEVVIRIVDNESGEVIRQIPGEEFLRFANRISNFNQKYLDETA